MSKLEPAGLVVHPTPMKTNTMLWYDNEFFSLTFEVELFYVHKLYTFTYIIFLLTVST